MIALVLAIPGFDSAYAQNSCEYEWVSQGNGDLYLTPNDIAIDANRNTYLAGSFKGRYQLGSTVLQSQGERNVFVSSLDSSGGFIWANSATADSSGAYNEAHGIAVDSQGNTYISGYFTGTAQFGSISLLGSGGTEIFVAKLDHNGNWLWAKRAGGSSNDYSYGIAVDQQDNLYITGKYSGTADFGQESFNVDVYNSKIFVAKLSPDGEWLWARSAGGTGTNTGFAITVDVNNGILLTGNYQGATADFGSTSVEGSSLEPYGFVVKLNSDGNWGWVETFKIVGGNSTDISTDQYGNCYICGYFRYFKCGDQNYYCNAYRDGFVATLNSYGGWLRFLQTSTSGTPNQGSNSILGITVDKEGNAYVAGTHNGNIKFGDVSLEQAGGFLAKWDYVEGGWDWAKAAGNANYAITIDEQENLYMAGQYVESAVFDSINLENTEYVYAENLFVANGGGSGTLPSGFPYYGFTKWLFEPVVSSTHNFQVKFSKALNPVSVENSNSSAIYVRTSNNEAVPVSLELTGENQDIIRVVQSSPYISGDTYYLYIDEDKIFSSQNTGSQQLPATIVMMFTVQ